LTDGDGLNELVVAHTDRIVRAYRWTGCDELQSACSAVTGQTASVKGPANNKLLLVDKWILSGQVCSNSRVAGRTVSRDP
jgi:Integrin-alpha FG-GAP repeat-containing protein 2